MKCIEYLSSRLPVERDLETASISVCHAWLGNTGFSVFSVLLFAALLFFEGSNVWCMLVDMACNGWQVAAQCAQLTLLSFMLFPKHFAQYAAGGWIIPAVLDLSCKLELRVGILSFGLNRRGSSRWKCSAVMSRQLQSKERPQIWWFKCIRTWY